MRLALIVEYDGTEYHGFQYQGDTPTVQEELEKAVHGFTGEDVRVKGAGRTDAGVHAEGQVVAFDTDSGQGPERFEKALNFYLPEDISIRAVHEVGRGFDPRRDATSRRYRYTVLNRPSRSPLRRKQAHLVRDRLNVMRMREGAKLFVGIHDFARFSGPLETPEASSVRRIIESVVRKSGEMVTFEVEGNAFLPHQVRRMAGALVDLARNKMTIDELRDILNVAPGGRVAHSLPAQGLSLLAVSYPNFPIDGGETR